MKKISQIKQQLSNIVFDAYTVLNWSIGNPIGRDYAEYSLRKWGKYGLLGVAGLLISCNPNPDDGDDDSGVLPDTTPPAITLEIDDGYLRGTGVDGSGVDLSLYVDKNNNSLFEESELVGSATANPNETARIDVEIQSISDLLSGTSYNAQLKGVDKSLATNETTTNTSFTTRSSDVTGPYSPTVTASTGITNGSISLDVLINGDDVSNQETEEVSGIATTKLYAIPIQANFEKSELESYGTLLATYTDEAGTTRTEEKTLATSNANYAIYSISEDNAGNETIDFEDLVLSGGPTQLGHRFIGSIEGFTGGTIDVYGVVGGFQEKLVEYTPESDGTINLEVSKYVNGSSLSLVYDGTEKQFTYQQGELDSVNF